MSARNLNTMPDITKYSLSGIPEEERAAPYRIVAHYLDWAAKNYPRQHTPWNVLARITTNRTTTPRASAADVINLKRCGSRVRKHLVTHYQRGMESLAGVGVRATTDSLDMMRTRIPQIHKRFEGATAGLQSEAALINLSEIPNNAETRPLKDWFTNNVAPSLRKLEAIQKALALPAALTRETPPGENK